MRASLRLLVLAALSPAVAPAQVPPSPSGPQPGQKVAFLGDSLVQTGFDRPNGYLHLIESAFIEQGRPIDLLKAGAGANVSADLLAHLKQDVLDQKPDWMTLICGGNDAQRGVSLDKFKANVSSLLDQITAAGIRVVVLSPPMLGEDQAVPNNQKLVPYVDLLRQLAAEKNVPFTDLNGAMQAEIAQSRAHLQLLKPGNILTTDGIHLNGLGEELVATAILQGFGFTPAQIAEVRDIWLDQLDGMDLTAHGPISARQYLQLRDVAAGQGTGVDEMLNRALAKDVEAMLTGPAPDHPSKPKKKRARAPNASAAVP